MTLGNNPWIKYIFTGDAQQTNPIAVVKDYRPHFGDPENNLTILENEVKFTGIVMEYKISRPKIDELVPPIIGLIALFTSVFYVFSAGFKSWSLQVSLIQRLSPEKSNKISQVTIKEWAKYLLHTKLLHFFVKSPKTIKATQREIIKLD